MFVTYQGTFVGLMAWQWRMVLLFLSTSCAVAATKQWAPQYLVMLPPLPLTVVGSAIGIFVSFRTNSAYQRWWEGRQLWGRLINTSRHLVLQLTRYAGFTDVVKAGVRDQVGYVHVFRCRLRQQDLRADAAVRGYFSAEDLERLHADPNACVAPVDRQMERVVRLHREGALDAMQLRSLDETLRQLLDVQGGCERIKNTPFPRGYGYIADRLIRAYAVLFPAGIVDTWAGGACPSRCWCAWPLN
jgi:putative membrane protein